MTRVLLIGAASLALASCGSQESAPQDGGGGTIGTPGKTISTPASATPFIPVPSDLPVWAPAFPGAKAAQVIVQGESRSAVKSVVLTTSANVRTVVDFYNAKIAAAGLTASVMQDTPDGAVRMVESASGARDMLMIGQANNSTSITLAYSVYR
jgi:hypothetical protein